MKQIDAKLIVWVVTVVFLAGGSFYTLQTVSSDVAELQETVGEAEGQLTIHVAADSHTGGDERINRIEAAQDKMSEDMTTIMVNQSAICQATGARCQ